MENLHKLVYEATINPERFRFFVAISKPFDTIRYQLLFRVNDIITKKVIVICNKGEFADYRAMETHKYACFEAMDLLEVEAEKTGYTPLALKEFAGALVAMYQLYNEQIDELI